MRFTHSFRDAVPFVLMVSTLSLASCGSNHPSSLTTEKRHTETHTGSDDQGKTSELKVSHDSSEALNEVQAVDLNDLNPSFDFSFAPVKDIKITTRGPTSILGLGCEKNFGYQMNVYSVGTDGQIDLTHNLGLGFSPTLLQGGDRYIVRIKLFLKQTCLGLSFKFDVTEDPST